MQYHGDLDCHSIRNYCCEIVTKFEDRGTKFDEIGSKDNPEMIKYTCLYGQIYHPRSVVAHSGCIFDHFGIVFRTKFVKFRTTIFKLRTSLVPTSYE